MSLLGLFVYVIFRVYPIFFFTPRPVVPGDLCSLIIPSSVSQSLVTSNEMSDAVLCRIRLWICTDFGSPSLVPDPV